MSQVTDAQAAFNQIATDTNNSNVVIAAIADAPDNPTTCAQATAKRDAFQAVMNAVQTAKSALNSVESAVAPKLTESQMQVTNLCT